MRYPRQVSILACAVVLAASGARAQELSGSVMRPTAVDPATGLVAGKLPGGEGATTYYVAVDLQPGDLIAQVQIVGAQNSGKKVEFEMLDNNARGVDAVYAMATLDAKAEATKTFPVDHAGRYVARVVVDGKESGSFCVLIGGSALPTAKASACPAAVADAARSAPATAPTVAPPAPPPPPPKPVVAQAPQRIEVVTSRCEERLRVGSDFLFDYDRAELRVEAEPALAELADHIVKADKAVLIEGHTDGKGSDRYNQALSERRAAAVRIALAGRGLAADKLNVRGYGKSHPVAPNAHEDGSDDPDGRQRNRRVEVVINTCS